MKKTSMNASRRAQFWLSALVILALIIVCVATVVRIAQGAAGVVTLKNIIMIIEITGILAGVVILASERGSRNVQKTKILSRLFAAESIVELLHGTIGMDQAARLFEIFNVGITMEFLLFVFIAYVFRLLADDYNK
jgi:uncharacterized membrane protein